MTHEKLRVSGETIDPRKIYIGSQVLALIKAAYDNGINHANKTLEQDKQAAYDRGYQAGYCEASSDFNTLRSLLRKLMVEEANE